MLRYDFRDRPLSSELLDDVYWKVDLDKCKKVGQVLQEAEETLRPLRSKGDKFLFETKTHSFTTFYGKVEPATLDLIDPSQSASRISPIKAHPSSVGRAGSDPDATSNAPSSSAAASGVRNNAPASVNAKRTDTS